MQGEWSGHVGLRRPKSAAEAGVEIDALELRPGEPTEGPNLRGQATERGVVRRNDQVSKIEVPVRGLGAPRRNRVDVDIQRPRRRRMQDEIRYARLLPSFAKGHDLALPLPGLGVTPWLEPAPELPVVEQEHAVAWGRHDDGAAGEMSFDDAAVERIGVVMGEGEDLGEVARLFRVLRRVLP